MATTLDTPIQYRKGCLFPHEFQCCHHYVTQLISNFTELHIRPLLVLLKSVGKHVAFVVSLDSLSLDGMHDTHTLSTKECSPTKLGSGCARY